MNNKINNLDNYIIDLKTYGQFEVSAENIFKALDLVQNSNNLPSALTLIIKMIKVKRANHGWVDVTNCVNFQ
nr:hypothetical protein [uncultured Pedobacter sp.]